ncbi:LapA family protein [Anoxybacillus sp. J5B_2022]|uniref:LapA family protein n=1 Tax=Anoxybacillus sp. J5B_2022 TaxID=3003246 RepID=UPI002285E808|nr:lipopolysaccharide assembly protein LapA domain-containing protein [Anoxybacillus sp. J5B_2022]MCZ0757056.1 lipopolysaccharide assembly protein LapA domain-containing protein [Anoxybacillus sp. J5B_2022]
MKMQWNLLFAMLFALIVSIFAVANVNAVSVNYLFGKTEWPLILIILGSTAMGGIIVASFGFFRIFQLQRQVKSLSKEKKELQEKVDALGKMNNVEVDSEK